MKETLQEELDDLYYILKKLHTDKKIAETKNLIKKLEDELW